jgi:hypothetical protein
MKLIALTLSGLLLLTGCSTEKKPEYDPVELIEYEACLSQVLNDEIDKIRDYIFECSNLKPVKK